MPELIHQRCFQHPLREAASRCMGCSRFFCRECITEHGGRLMCAACLSRTAQAAISVGYRPVIWALLALAGFVLAWLVFFYLGVALTRVPADFHGGLA